MKVRQAESADIDIIASFNQAMAEETEGKTLPSEKIFPGVTEMLNNPELGFYLVVEDAGVVIACLGVTFEWSDWRNGLFWWIQSVYVTPDARRKGAFQMMYAEVTSRAKLAGNVCGLRLYVEKDNKSAQQTYLSLGMIETEYKLLEVEFT